MRSSRLLDEHPAKAPAGPSARHRRGGGENRGRARASACRARSLGAPAGSPTTTYNSVRKFAPLTFFAFLVTAMKIALSGLADRPEAPGFSSITVRRRCWLDPKPGHLSHPRFRV